MDRNDYLTFRCKNKHAHLHNGQPADGNIVAFVNMNSIILRCIDAKCKGWTKLTFDLPGIDLDLRKAGITQQSLPQGLTRVSSRKASVIIDLPEQFTETHRSDNMTVHTPT